MIGVCLPGHSDLGVEALNRLTSQFRCAFSCPASYPNVHDYVRQGHLWTQIPYTTNLNATSDEWVVAIQEQGEKLSAFVCILNYRQKVPFELLTIESIEEHHRYNNSYPLQTLINLTDNNLISLTAPVVFVAQTSDDHRNYLPYSCAVSSLSASLAVMKRYNDFFSNLSISFSSARSREEYDRLTEDISKAIRPRSLNGCENTSI